MYVEAGTGSKTATWIFSGRMDLLTVLAHEIGHLLGHDHADEGAMAETLAAGSRVTPAVDWGIFSEGAERLTRRAK